MDEFDSDLWNNDERFTEQEIASALCEEDEIDISKALTDARKVPAPVAPATKVVSAVAKATEGSRRFVVLDNHDLTPHNM